MSTNTAFIHEVVQEYRRLRGETWSDPAALAEAALFVEDVFDIQLCDEEISGEELGSPEKMARLVEKKLRQLGE